VCAELWPTWARLARTSGRKKLRRYADVRETDCLERGVYELEFAVLRTSG
jgi:hypothetical protein